jgi:hypothetical protein
MDLHEVDMKGKFWVERLASLPTWTSDDIGRLVYITSNGSFYKATSEGWEAFQRTIDIFPGYMQRPLFTYISTTSIGIGTGRYHHNGTNEAFLTWSSDLTYNFGSMTASTWYYLYIDDSALGGSTTLTSSDLTHSTNEPSWDNTKGGWYRNDDRCIFAIRTTSSGTIRRFFHLNDCIHWADYIQIWNTNVSPSWTTLTFYAPNFCNNVHGTVWTKTGSDVSDASQFAYWRVYGSTGSGFMVGRSNRDRSGSGSGQHYQREINTVAHFRLDESGKRIQLRHVHGNQMQVWQNGWYLPLGM